MCVCGGGGGGGGVWGMCGGGVGGVWGGVASYVDLWIKLHPKEGRGEGVGEGGKRDSSPLSTSLCYFLLLALQM